MKRIFAFAILAILFGCNEQPTSNNSAAGKNTVRLVVFSVVENQESEEQTFDQLDAKLIESKIRALKWNGPKCYCRVVLDNTADFSQLMVAGSFKPAENEEVLMAQWWDKSGGENAIRKCKEIQSVDQIVALCNSFFNNDGKLKALVKWDDVLDLGEEK